MRECLLCKKDMTVSRDAFGGGCIKNIYTFLGMPMPKKVKLREPTLYRNIMKITNTKNISATQKIWLADRYLTYQYLSKITYGNFELIKQAIENDIKNIKQYINEIPKSNTIISLKQAYDLYKKANRFKTGLDKIIKGKITDEDSLKSLATTISFIFHLSKNKKQYENNILKAMQYVFWQTVIEIGGNYEDFPVSAKFLQHSLEENPEDLVITEGRVVEEIKTNESFISNINNITKKYGENCEEFMFDGLKDTSFPMTFNDKDLYFALHDTMLRIKGTRDDSRWNLEVIIHDKYDYSQRKELLQYYNDTSSISKSLLSSTLYNLARFSNLSGVMKEYDIDIIIHLEGFEVF